MNWWFASSGEKKIWVNVDRWFNARAFIRSKLGEQVDATKSAAPSKADYESGSVFVGKWSRHDAAPNSNLSFFQASPPVEVPVEVKETKKGTKKK